MLHALFHVGYLLYRYWFIYKQEAQFHPYYAKLIMTNMYHYAAEQQLQVYYYYPYPFTESLFSCTSKIMRSLFELSGYAIFQNQRNTPHQSYPTNMVED